MKKTYLFLVALALFSCSKPNEILPEEEINEEVELSTMGKDDDIYDSDPGEAEPGGLGELTSHAFNLDPATGGTIGFARVVFPEFGSITVQARKNIDGSITSMSHTPKIYPNVLPMGVRHKFITYHTSITSDYIQYTTTFREEYYSSFHNHWHAMDEFSRTIRLNFNTNTVDSW